MKAPYDIFDYPSYWQDRLYEDEADKLAIKTLLKKVKKRDSLIDIAGGFGRLSTFLAPEFKRVLLVDQSKGLLDEAQKKIKDFDNISLKQSDCEKLPSKDESFDIALMIRIIHHLENPQKAFQEAYRVLKPGGFLILEFANKLHFLACVKASFGGDYLFSKNLKPLEKRSSKAIRKKMITFCNHHPQAVEKALIEAGFTIVDRLSASNLRWPLFKKILPLPILLKIESILQRPASKVYFGPSIYLLLRKN